MARNVRPSALVLFGILTGLFLGELGIRLYFQSTRNRIDLAQSRLLPISAGYEIKNKSIGTLVQPSRFEQIVYELRPNVQVKFLGKKVRTNGYGWRMKELLQKKPANTIRILGLGDSHTFGWGVAEHETYLAVLERLLQKNYPQTNWEVINTAVPGYNTVMEVATLDFKGLAFEPDIVLIDCIANDFILPDFLYDPPSYLFSDVSYLWKLMSEGALAAGGSNLVRTTDQWRIPKAYRHLAGQGPFKSSLQRLAQLQRQHNFHTYLFNNHDAYVIAPGRRLAGMAKWLKSWTDQNNIAFTYQEKREQPQFWLSPEDKHLNPLAHYEKGNLIFRELQRQGLLPKKTAAQRQS